jgi:hypothetical protein
MSLKARITEDMKTAMKAKETAKLSPFACCSPPSSRRKSMSASNSTTPPSSPSSKS